LKKKIYFGNEKGYKHSDKIKFGKNLHPTQTKGTGSICKNNIVLGTEQGSPSNTNYKVKIQCKQCGFYFDYRKNDVSGGTRTGKGGYGSVTTGTDSVQVPFGLRQSFSEPYGEQTVRKGQGCPFCGSKNGMK